MNARTRTIRLAAALSMIVGAAAFTLPQVAYAYFIGGERTTTTYGAWQNIEVSNPVVTSGGASSAHVMIKKGYGYALAGLIKLPSFTSPRYYYEYADSSGTWWRGTYSAPAVGGTPGFIVQSGPYVGAYFDFMYRPSGMSTWTEMTYVGSGELGWGDLFNPPDDAWYEATTKNYGDKKFGSPSNPRSFTSAKWLDATEAWHTSAVTMRSTGYNYGWSWIHQYDSFNVWDTRP